MTFQLSQEVYAQATNSYRTKLSLQLFAAGMFFPDQTQIAFDPKFNWRPLKFESPKLESDPILYPLGKSCPRLVKEFNEVYAPVLIENEQLFSNLSKLTGLSFKNAFDIISLASIVDTQVCWCRFHFLMKIKVLVSKYTGGI